MNLQDKTQEDVLQCHANSVTSIAISSDNKYIVFGGRDRIVRIWNLKDKTQESVLQGHTDSVKSIAITSNTKYIVLLGETRL